MLLGNPLDCIPIEKDELLDHKYVAAGQLRVLNLHCSSIYIEQGLRWLEAIL